MSTAVATSTLRNRSTPGVYITEIPAFSTSIVAVPSAVPIFIGYTQFAQDPKTGTLVYNTAVPISSMTEFMQYFGAAYQQTYVVAMASPPATPTSTPGTSSGPAPTPTPTAGPAAEAPLFSFPAAYTKSDQTIGNGTFNVTAAGPSGEANQFNLYWSMQLFFANGGGQCFVVSVGDYGGDLTATRTSAAPTIPGQIRAEDLASGLTAAANAVGPTMIVVPEACQLGASDYGAVVQQMLQQASALQDRVAILDLPGCLSASTLDDLQAAQGALSTAIAPAADSLSYGVVYAPALNTSIVTVNDVLYTNLVSEDGDNSIMNSILTAQATQLYASNTAALTAVKNAIATAFPTTGAAATALTPSAATTLDNLLLNALPIFTQIEQLIANSINVAPPSGVMAGIWAKSDALNGVWNAPANMSLAAVVSPLYNMSDADQAGFNMPTNGQAIDILRALPGRGTVVWGARTLDGNSQDYRYVQVRRTLVNLEQTIKTALQSYVFAPNDATTWSTVTASISGFLTGIWQQGGLMGSKPGEAFSVQCGLGSTMTAQDIINGYMVVAITLQMIHPAEFIELTFTQTMGS